jgi:hypothetical protein
MRAATSATNTVHTTLITTDSRNCHQVASPNPTNAGIAKGAVGGR